ncbi:unnamed protein product, partial [Hapterophycus canaliculatus]
VDLAHCSTWLKFSELHEEGRTTVVFLCGGGVRLAEEAGTPESFHTATISDLIRGTLDAEVSSPSGTVESGGENGGSGDGDGNGCEGTLPQGLEAAFEAKLGAEFLWGLVSRDWAGVLLDCLSRLEAAALDRRDVGEALKTVSGKGKAAGAATAAAEVGGKSGRLEEPPDAAAGGEKGDSPPALAESSAEVRAAFGLFDPEGNGWVTGDRLRTCLLDASVRISARCLKQLLSRVCRVAGDGKRFFFEYRKRLASHAVDAEARDEQEQEQETGAAKEERAE